VSENVRTRGIDIDPETRKQGNPYYEWMHNEYLATEEMKSLIPPGSTFILVDDGNWAENWGGHGGDKRAPGHPLSGTKRALLGRAAG
jgi:hypothetical protein